MSDSWAKPTDGGLNRNTENTFFCNKSSSAFPVDATTNVTRKVSPIIQGGAEEPIENSKKAPRQLPLLNLASRKSAGLIVQFFPPKDKETVTVVLQAEK